MPRSASEAKPSCSTITSWVRLVRNSGEGFIVPTRCTISARLSGAAEAVSESAGLLEEAQIPSPRTFTHEDRGKRRCSQEDTERKFSCDKQFSRGRRRSPARWRRLTTGCLRQQSQGVQRARNWGDKENEDCELHAEKRARHRHQSDIAKPQAMALSHQVIRCPGEIEKSSPQQAAQNGIE